jgi:hypothetical protein
MTKDNMQNKKNELRNLRLFALAIIIVFSGAMYIVHKYAKNMPNEFTADYYRGIYGR